jgi:hypothetical protein
LAGGGSRNEKENEMPCLTVKIVYDRPVDDPYWLNEDNVSIALQAYCKNTRFEVTTVVPWALCENERIAEEEVIETQ